jgi:hypothetical protein
MKSNWSPVRRLAELLRVTGQLDRYQYLRLGTTY